MAIEEMFNFDFWRAFLNFFDSNIDKAFGYQKILNPPCAPIELSPWTMFHGL